MCGFADTKIKDNDVHVFLGYYGGRLTINGISYCEDERDDSKFTPETKQAVIDELNKYSKEDIINMLVSLPENADE